MGQVEVGCDNESRAIQLLESLQLQLVRPQGEPLARENILVYIEFYVGGVMRYVLAAGMIDPQGLLQILPSALEEQLAFNRAAAQESSQTTLEEYDTVSSLAVLPGALIDNLVEMLRNAPSTPKAVADLRMYRSAANHMLAPTRTAFNLEDVPTTGRASLMLDVEPAGA